MGRGIIEARPSRRTCCRFGVEVSSIDYTVNGRRFDETAVFGDGLCEVVGTYDDHDATVAKYGAI